MTELHNYFNDGANPQAKATLMYLQYLGNIEDSWNSDRQEYDAKVKVARWENFREQGYIVSLVNKNNKQINIAFFEHRNSDNIHAIKWEQNSLNSLTIDTAEFGDVYKTKYDTSFSVGYGQAYEMATWVFKQLDEHWKQSNKTTE